MALLLTATIGLCCGSLGRAFPAPKRPEPAGGPNTFGIRVISANHLRRGDAVDVFLTETGPGEADSKRLILSGMPVAAVEIEPAGGPANRRFLILLAAGPREQQVLLAASMRGTFDLTAHDPDSGAGYGVPRAGESFSPVLIGD